MLSVFLYFWQISKKRDKKWNLLDPATPDLSSFHPSEQNPPHFQLQRYNPRTWATPPHLRPKQYPDPNKSPFNATTNFNISRIKKTTEIKPTKLKTYRPQQDRELIKFNRTPRNQKTNHVRRRSAGVPSWTSSPAARSPKTCANFHSRGGGGPAAAAASASTLLLICRDRAAARA